MKLSDFEIRYVFVKYVGSDGYLFDIFRGNIRLAKIATYNSIDDYVLDLKKYIRGSKIPIFHQFFIRFPLNSYIVKKFENDLKRYPKIFDSL